MSFLTDEWRAGIRAKADSPDLAAARAALAAQNAAYHATLPDLPDRQAGYYHDFFCPRHAVQLIFDPRGPERHVCPVDGEIFRGEPFDSAWRWSVNDVLSDAALKLAFQSFLRGAEPEAADVISDRARARAILLGYAERYRTMPTNPVLHPTHPGVVTWSGLDEAVWIIRLTWAHALLGGSLSASDDRTVRDDLLRPAADHMRRIRWPEIHNVTNWNNGAIATLAIALDDSDLLDFALAGPVGLSAELAQGVRPDGFWWEGSLSYHYYTLAALIWTARVLRASGHGFDDKGVLRQMLRAPLAIAFPDLTLPAIHDCWDGIGLTGKVGHGIPNADGFYEVANGWYGDPEFAWILGQNYARHPRTPFEALLDGSLTIPAAPEPAFSSYHTDDSGLAVIRTRQPRERQTYLMLKAGPDARDHGHPDQLSLQLFANGVRMASDLGTPGYGIGLNDTWYRQTASHATVLLDGHSQPLASGRLGPFREHGDVTIAEGTVTWDEGTSASVQLRRVLLGREDYFVDLFEVVTAAEHQIDWLYQHRGDLIESPAGTAVGAGLAGDCGYAHVTNVSQVQDPSASRLRWQKAGARLDLYLPPASGEETFFGTAPGNPAHDHLSLLVRRRQTTRTTFVAVFAPSDPSTEPTVRGVRWLQTATAPFELAVETAQGSEHWRIGPDLVNPVLTISPRPLET